MSKNKGELEKRIKNFTGWVNCSESQIKGRPQSFKIFDQDVYDKIIEDAKKEFLEAEKDTLLFLQIRQNDIFVWNWFKKWFGE